MKKVLLLLLIILTGCPSYEDLGSQSLCVRNGSEQSIFYWYSSDFDFYHFPNTLLPTHLPIRVCGAGSGSCVGNDAGQFPKWNTIYAQLPEDKFTIYFFDKLATTQEEWDDIRINHLVLRKDVTLQELKEKNFTM